MNTTPNQNEIYLIEQPKKTIITLLFFDEKSYDIGKEVHDNIFRLTEQSDTIIIFPQKSTIYDLDKIASLYGAIGWIIGESTTETLMKCLKYDGLIFKIHTTAVITTLSKLKNQEITTLTPYQGEVQWPVLNIKRMDYYELKEIYTLPKRKWWQIKKQEEKGNNKFAAYKCTSNIVILKTSIILQLYEDYTEEKLKNWMNTFTFNDPTYLISAWIKKKNIKWMEFIDKKDETQNTQN